METWWHQNKDGSLNLEKVREVLMRHVPQGSDAHFGLDAIMARIAALAELERERNELRAKLAEYERAPTIGVIRDVGRRPYCDWKVSQATLPKSGAEIIARPTRKGEA